MSNNITTILEAMHADPAMIRLSKGLSIPVIGDQYKLHKDFFYAFPPVLLPIFEDNGGPVLRGLIRHWFVQRDTVYVKFLLEAGMFLEAGRNAQQVIADMILQMDMVKEAITPEIASFAEEVGFDNPQAIDDFAEEYGDNPADYHRLEIFARDLPLSYAPDLNAYKGDFPAAERLVNTPQLEKACAFEADASPDIPGVDWPVWLIEDTDKQKLFDQFFKEKAFDKAWLTLNSRGWKIADAIIALQRLQAVEQDPLFHLISENWIQGWKDAGKTHEMY